MERMEILFAVLDCSFTMLRTNYNWNFIYRLTFLKNLVQGLQDIIFLPEKNSELFLAFSLWHFFHIETSGVHDIRQDQSAYQASDQIKSNLYNSNIIYGSYQITLQYCINAMNTVLQFNMEWITLQLTTFLTSLALFQRNTTNAIMWYSSSFNFRSLSPKIKVRNRV